MAHVLGTFKQVEQRVIDPGHAGGAHTPCAPPALK
jgi:hypothetical protein